MYKKPMFLLALFRQFVIVLISIAVVLNSISCKSEPPQPQLESALVMAGDNRAELEKVLAKYSLNPADSLKYKSAVFLIENMPGHFYYTGEGMVNGRSYFKALREDRKSHPRNILDSLVKLNGGFKLEKKQIAYDIQTIDSAYLCKNIELAFKAWESFPWTKHYSFEDFREYILPYRVGNESLTDWRETFFNSYSDLIKNSKTADPIEIAKLLRSHIIKKVGSPRFTMIRPKGYPTIDALTSQQMAGSCDDLAVFAISLFRTFGIVCSRDYIPIRGEINYGHSWVSLMNHKGEYYLTDFFKAISFISEKQHNRLMMKAKVFRNTFSTNEEYAKLKEKPVVIPDVFAENNYRYTDVTLLYSNNLTNLQLSKADLYEHNKLPPVVFLCALAWMDWIPITWSESNTEGGVDFKDVDSGSIMRIAYGDETDLKFLSAPFFIDKQTRRLVFFDENDQTEDITLFSKYRLNRDKKYSNRLIGGRFEGADNPDFNNPDILYTIKASPDRLFTEVVLDSSKKYKYLRYKGGSKSYCDVAEVEFISHTNKVEGEVIGKKGTWNNGQSYDYKNVFDGRTETSYHHSTRKGGWAGLKLEQPKQITKIRYAPRNHDNYIKKGDDYELFMSTKSGWKSLGRKEAASDSLVYTNIPINSLLYLKNHTGGEEERVFTMEDNKQVYR